MIIDDILIIDFTDENNDMRSRLRPQVVIPHKLVLKSRMNVSSDMNPFTDVGIGEAGNPERPVSREER